MSMVGTQLLAPQAGWKRYDDRCGLVEGNILYYNNAAMYNGTWAYSTLSNGYYKFRFKGSKFRIIGYTYPNSSYGNCKVIVDGIEHLCNMYYPTEKLQIVLFELLNLSDAVHEVEVRAIAATPAITLDAIDIDNTGRLLHSTIPEVFDVKDFKKDTCIRFNYSATTGQVGVISNLGKETANLIPPISSASPNGDAYLVGVAEDYLGRTVGAIDRPLQHSIPWDTLNANGVVNGKSLKYNPKNPLVAHFPLVEAGTKIYDITDRHNGDCTGTTVQTIDGIKYRYFNGSPDGIMVNAILVPTGKKTIRLKVKCTPPTSGFYTLLSTRSYGETGISAYLLSSGHIQFVKGTNNTSAILLQSDIIVADNQLHEIEFSWTGDTTTNGVRLKIDDTVKFATATVTDTVVHARYLRIGYTINNLGQNSDFFKGYLADLSVYSDTYDKITEPLVDDKYTYQLRLPTGGISATDKDNEWDKLLAENTLEGLIPAGDNSIWNWSGMTSYTSTTPNGMATNRVIRGNVAKDTWNSVASCTANTTLGFRPLLLVGELKPLYYRRILLGDSENNLYNNQLEIIGTGIPTAELYQQHGFESLALISPLLLKDLPQPLRKYEWITDPTFKSESLIKAIPPLQFIPATGDLDISNVEYIINAVATCNTTGGGYVGIVISTDQGATWQAYNESQWISVDVTSSAELKTLCMTPAIFNSLAQPQWDLLNIEEAQRIRFGYALAQVNISDVANSDRLSLSLKLKGALVKAHHMIDYELSYPEQTLLRVKVLTGGDYVIDHTK